MVILGLQYQYQTLSALPYADQNGRNQMFHRTTLRNLVLVGAIALMGSFGNQLSAQAQQEEPSEFGNPLQARAMMLATSKTAAYATQGVLTAFSDLTSANWTPASGNLYYQYCLGNFNTIAGRYG